MTDPYAQHGWQPGQQGAHPQGYPAWQPGQQGAHPQGYPGWQPGQSAAPPPASYPPMSGSAGGYGMPPQRPGTVLAGAIMTYIGSGLLVFLGLILLFGVLAAGDEFATGVSEGAGIGADPGTVQAAAIGAGIGVLAQGVLLIVAAAFAQRGSNGWRIALTVIGGINVLFNLAQLTVAAAMGLLTLAYVVVAVILFWVGNANAWYRAQRATR